jgi:hypothetical protein
VHHLLLPRFCQANARPPDGVSRLAENVRDAMSAVEYRGGFEKALNNLNKICSMPSFGKSGLRSQASAAPTRWRRRIREFATELRCGCFVSDPAS